MTREQYLEIRSRGDLRPLFSYLHTMFCQQSGSNLPFPLFYMYFKNWMEVDGVQPNYWRPLDQHYEINFVWRTPHMTPENLLALY